MSKFQPEWDQYHMIKQGKIKNTLFPLEKYISLTNGNRILDIGIGNGEKTFELLQNEFHLTGIESSEKAIELCKENILKLKIEANRIKLIHANFFDLEFDFSKYNIIIISHVLQFFSEKELNQIFKKINSEAKKGTIIYLQVFSEKEYEKYKLKEISKEKIQMHFFSEKELKQIFSYWKTLSFINMELLDLSHGEPHYHHTITYTAIK